MNIKIIVGSFFSLLFFSNSGFAKIHILKKGETLASVARAYYGEPVFGPRGSILKIYIMNPTLKLNPNLVEPGFKVVLEDKVTETAEVEEQAAEPTHANEAHEAPEATAVVATPAHGSTPAPTQTESVAAPAPVEELTLQKEIPEKTAEKVEEIKKLDEAPAPKIESAPSAIVATPTAEAKAEFFIAPLFSQVQIATTHAASGNTLNLSSASSLGLRAGWDRNWSPSFATLLTGEYKQFKSTDISSVTSAVVADQFDLYHFDFALLNELTTGIRAGFGLSYGRDLFIETDASSLVPTAFSSTATSPFVMADFSVLKWASSEFNVETKVTLHPAEAGGEHDLKKGTAVLLGFQYQQKFDQTTGFSVGLSYETNDQARVGMTQKRDDMNLEVGYQF